MQKIKTSFITEQRTPLVVEPSDSKAHLFDLLELLESKNLYFKDELTKHGGLLFRNFPVKDEHDFSAVIEKMNTGKSLDYIGGDSPRNKILNGIYTSTEAPPSVKIPLHNELSFVKNFPKHIYFFCQHATETGGETILGDARTMYKKIDPKLKEEFFNKGLKYVSCYYHKSKVMEFINKIQPSHKSWTQVFETEVKDEVEQKCKDNDFGFQWNRKDWLKISQQRPAFHEHPITKETVWFNQVHLYDFNPKLLGWWRFIGAKLVYAPKHTRLHEVFYGDDSRITKKSIYHIMDVLDQNTISFPWKAGDVLVLDNILMMHGRATFSGKRRIMAAMTG